MEQTLRMVFPDKYRAAFLAIFILLSFGGYAQTYNPSAHVVVNDAISPAQATPTDSRSMFYDGTNFVYRPYQNTSEVLSYLNLAKYRFGNFFIIVDSGGTLLSNGVYLNGHNTYYVFSDTTSSAGLVKLNLFGGGGCSGCLLAANNLSDLANAGTARSNLGLGGMATQSTTALGTDISGTWPSALTVNSIQGHNLAYILNYANHTNTPPLVSLTTTGSSGVATYNTSTGVLNIPNYSGGGGSCLNCNADTIGHVALNFTTFPNGSVLTLDSAAGYAYWAPSTGGSATIPPNIGTGYPIYSPQIPGFKKLICNSGCTIDSTTNTNSLTFNITGGSVGTVTLFSANNITGFATQSVTNATTTPNLIYTLVSAPAYNVWMNNTASPATPVYAAPTATIMNSWFGGTIQPAISLTTTGTGTPTFISNTLNIPTAVMTYSQLATTNTININPGNTQTFLTATNLLAGLLDTSRAKTIDSLHNRIFTWPVASVSNSDGTLTISPTTGSVVASLALGHANTWTGLQTFNSNITMGSQFQFSSDNVYSIGSGSAGAAHVWSRVFNSDAGVTLESTSGSPVALSIGSTIGVTLLSTGQVQFNNYTGSAYSNTSNDSILTINPTNGNIGWKWGQPYTIYAVQGISPIGTHADSFALGGSASPLYQADSIFLAFNHFFMVNMLGKATVAGTDSVVIKTAAGEEMGVPVSAIGGGSGDNITSPNSTINVGGTSTNTTLDVNPASPINWTTAPLPAATNTTDFGSSSKTWNNLWGNIMVGSSQVTIKSTGANPVNISPNGTTQAVFASGGAVRFNAYTTTSSFPVTAVGQIVFDASGDLGTQSVNDVTTVITTGSSSTVPNGTTVVQFNPTTLISSYTLTLPTTWNVNNDLLIVFTANGTITNGNTMVTTFSVVNGAGQTLSQYVVPSTGLAGTSIRYHLISGTVDQRIN